MQTRAATKEGASGYQKVKTGKGKAVRFNAKLTQTKVIARKTPAYCRCDDLADDYTAMVACEKCHGWHSTQCANFTPPEESESKTKTTPSPPHCLDCRKRALWLQIVDRLKEGKAPTYVEVQRLCDKLGLQTSGDANDLNVRLACFLNADPTDRFDKVCDDHGEEAQLANLSALTLTELSDMCKNANISLKIKKSEKVRKLRAWLCGFDPDLVMDEEESTDKENVKPKTTRKKTDEETEKLTKQKGKKEQPLLATKGKYKEVKQETTKVKKKEQDDTWGDLSAFTAEELRDECHACGLKTTGKKEELIKRLSDHLAKEDSERTEIREKAQAKKRGSQKSACKCDGGKTCDICMASLIEGLLV